MKSKDLEKLGIPHGEPMTAAKTCLGKAAQAGLKKRDITRELSTLTRNPERFRDNAVWAHLANVMIAYEKDSTQVDETSSSAPYTQWGSDLDPQSVQQMEMACRLPVSVRGALMPDAHVGYGLPIGGVLATKGAVIPYAVGVDIACRMKMTVLDMPLRTLDEDRHDFRKAISAETRFGIGSAFKDKRHHPVMDEDWSVSPITKAKKDKAWAQLGTSGSGNHFVEFGVLEVFDGTAGLPEGRYIALLSHSGSRGTGASVCDHYSKLAMRRCRDLQKQYRHLSWLNLDTEEGQEYWNAMQLMGKYAAANHACIHDHIAKHLGAEVMLDIENHHNFAWKEVHDGEELIVHRKGATPASEGILGIIPGSMAAPGYVVIGKGNKDSLCSAAHGAGRVMSRKKAKKRFHWKDVKPQLEAKGVELMSAGLDEVPGVYKNINEVMAAQDDLVENLARFQPKLVKMAPAGERPED